MPLLQLTDRGLWCERGDFYIDPVRVVDRAVITHGHSDHARKGMRSYLTHEHGVGLLKYRLGEHITVQGATYGEPVNINGVRVSLHPSGHVRGAAQVRVEHAGEVWVVSGDYKRELDPCTPEFEVVRCHTFITESTFGLPVYVWPHPDTVIAEINAWWKRHADDGIPCALLVYPLGKGQRLPALLDHSIGPVVLSESIVRTNESLYGERTSVDGGRWTVDTGRWTVDDMRRALHLTSSSQLNVHSPQSTVHRLKSPPTPISGWNATRNLRTWTGFVMSDHADWPGLLRTVRETEAEHVLTYHGFEAELALQLRTMGIDAKPLGADNH
jgi:putative mRNA 3-end processing factor